MGPKPDRLFSVLSNPALLTSQHLEARPVKYSTCVHRVYKGTSSAPYTPTASPVTHTRAHAVPLSAPPAHSLLCRAPWAGGHWCFSANGIKHRVLQENWLVLAHPGREAEMPCVWGCISISPGAASSAGVANFLESSLLLSGCLKVWCRFFW